MYSGERFNAGSHLLALALALAGTAVLLDKILPAANTAKGVGALVFAGCAVALFGASTLFHSTRGRTRLFWERADHCAVYLLIAGTYTPFALATAQGAWDWSLLGAIWLGALLAIAREIGAGGNPRPSLAIYVAMGWFSALAAAPLAARLDGAGLAWLAAGTGFYTGGILFYRNPWRWRHAHGMWHLFVLAGTASHFAAINWYVL